MNLTENGKKVLEARYLKRDVDGKLCESAETLFHRVAHNIASAETKYKSENPAVAQLWEDKFYKIMTDLDFLPNSPTLMNAGRDLQQLSACFVLSIADSMESIFDAVKNSALIQKSGGGCFRKGTKIMLLNGFIKDIEEIDEGERVLCYNIEKQKVEVGIVKNTFRIDVTKKKKVRVSFEDGSFIYCTDDHPFRVKTDNNESWVAAKDLTSDMNIVSKT